MINLKGAPVSEQIQKQIISELKTWSDHNMRTPHLVVILIGEDPASQIYVQRKQDMCQKLGFTSEVLRFEAEVDQNILSQKIEILNTNNLVDGILVQLPLPSHLNTRQILETISPDKDVDCLTEKNLGQLLTGNSVVKPCTPSGILELFKFYKINLTGKKIAIVGRSLIVGTPLMLMLIKENATVSLFHSQSLNINSELKNFDIICVAVGKEKLVQFSNLKKDSILIDVGMNRTETGLVGDVFNDLPDQDYLQAATPVPGGVGLMTIAMLMKNTMTLALRNRILEKSDLRLDIR